MASAGEVSKKLAGLSKTTPIASERSVKKGVGIIRGEALAAIGVATHGTFTLRGVRARSTGAEAKVGVTSKIIGSGSNTEGFVRATGPWQFVEHDIPAHPVGVRLEANGDQAVMLTPQGPRTGPWIAGGSTGKHPWRLSSKRSRAKVVQLYDEEVSRHIRSNF